MKRRAFSSFAGAAMLGLPAAVRAQQRAMPVIGYLAASTPESGMAFVPAFHDGLRETGHVVGRNVAIVFRWASNHHDQLPALASELVAARVAVIVATNSLAAVAAKKTTQTIPIAFLSGDPVALGLVDSLGRPGGNATGISILTPELTPKRLELVRELLPGARSVAFLTAPTNPATAHELADMQAAARSTGHHLHAFEVRTEAEVEQALAHLAGQRPDALLVGAGPLFISQRDRIIALAARYAIPAVYDWPDYTAAGGLVSYGPSLKDAIRLVGVYAGKMLGGARPADLPVQQPTRFELVINLRTARALGLSVPTTLLDRADEVIE